MVELFGKPFNEWKVDDIISLVEEKMPESRILEYKRELHKSSDDGNKEFLKDISAFANTTGGYLIYGIAENEKDRVPTEIKGIEVDSFDNLKLRFENLLRMGVEPAIRGVNFRIFDYKGTSKIVVAEVPKSISRPHVVKINKQWRFYGRHSSGVYPLELEDLRREILAGETLAAKIRNFRNDRLAHIALGQEPTLSANAKVIMHLIPESAFELGKKYDLTQLQPSEILPICQGCNGRYSFDGLLAYYEEKGIIESYAQLFHNGIIEVMETGLFGCSGQTRFISSDAFKRKLSAAFGESLACLKKLNVELPIWICLAVFGVKGFYMFQGHISLNMQKIDRNELILPEIQITSYDCSGSNVLRPAFDLIWNACGYKDSDQS